MPRYFCFVVEEMVTLGVELAVPRRLTIIAAFEFLNYTMLIVIDYLILSILTFRTLMYVFGTNHLAMERFRLSNLAMRVTNELCQAQRGKERKERLLLLVFVFMPWYSPFH